MIKEQILAGGDWQVKNPDGPPGGWAFEFDNDIYPNLDDTAEVLIALDRVRIPDDDERRRALDLGLRWLLSMQSRNGGWGAFDKDNDRTFIAKIPFADFGEVLDPPSVDVTAHVLEMLGRLGYRDDFTPVRTALEYMLDDQEPDGGWFGRWGVNYVYGIGAVLPALEALDYDMSKDNVRRAVRWIENHQHPDGGWGESCASYVDSTFRGRGDSTASQTAWALLALLAAGEGTSDAVEKGVRYLIHNQQGEGNWDEPYFTGTGFPGYGIGQRLDRYLSPKEDGFQGTDMRAGFMINYHMYRNYWPLMALGRYKSFLEKTDNPGGSKL